MERIRKPFQGAGNIIRFNWHFYFFTFCLLLSLLIAAKYLTNPFRIYLIIIFILVCIPTLVSLLVSFYIYDLSGLYNFKWLEDKNLHGLIVNINAGFDETSLLLKENFKNIELTVFDFYDPLKHTEVSIKRARKAYPAFPGTSEIKTTYLPLGNNSADNIFVILSAHEIRNEAERIEFFKELKRVIKPTGQIFITEHLRDTANFLAYTIGFFHFYSKTSWFSTFKNAGLNIKDEIKLTPFISTFTLDKNGNTL